MDTAEFATIFRGQLHPIKRTVRSPDLTHSTGTFTPHSFTSNTKNLYYENLSKHREYLKDLTNEAPSIHPTAHYPKNQTRNPSSSSFQMRSRNTATRNVQGHESTTDKFRSPLPPSSIWNTQRTPVEDLFLTSSAMYTSKDAEYDLITTPSRTSMARLGGTRAATFHRTDKTDGNLLNSPFSSSQLASGALLTSMRVRSYTGEHRRATHAQQQLSVGSQMSSQRTRELTLQQIAQEHISQCESMPPYESQSETPFTDYIMKYGLREALQLSCHFLPQVAKLMDNLFWTMAHPHEQPRVSSSVRSTSPNHPPNQDNSSNDSLADFGSMLRPPDVGSPRTPPMQPQAASPEHVTEMIQLWQDEQDNQEFGLPPRATALQFMRKANDAFDNLVDDEQASSTTQTTVGSAYGYRRQLVSPCNLRSPTGSPDQSMTPTINPFTNFRGNLRASYGAGMTRTGLSTHVRSTSESRGVREFDTLRLRERTSPLACLLDDDDDDDDDDDPRGEIDAASAELGDGYTLSDGVGRRYNNDQDRMVYVSWIPKKARAFTTADKRKQELELKRRLREVLRLTGLNKVLLFPPKGVHCKLIFDHRNSAGTFLERYGGDNCSEETERWKVDLCRVYDIDMLDRFDKTVVKIEWSQK